MPDARSFYDVDLDGADEGAVASTADVMRVFDFLKPKASKSPLIRIGGDIDGSYLVPDDLDGIAACFSPGVNRIKYFEDHLTDRYGIASHMCDFTCDVADFTTPLKEGKQTFLKKWLDVRPDEDNISLEDWIAANDVTGDLLLQMDIEGAEYRNILGTSDETLARFRMIVIELHGLGELLDGPILHGVLAPFFEKLSRTFTTVHAHPNNCCGDVEVPGTDVRIPRVLELTLIRSDRFVPTDGPPSLPHPLDVGRNVPRNPPLFLSDAWCDYRRPVESRVKMLEDTMHYRDTVGASAADSELAGVVARLMQSIQTATAVTAGTGRRTGGEVEVAAGRPYRLSSAYGSTGRTGVVGPSSTYFFHTDFGANQSIQVDLGRHHRIRRIEIDNRRDGYQDRARYIFAEFGTDADSHTAVVPMFTTGDLADGAWETCSVDIPDIAARYVTITTPLNTALHFSDLRIHATAGTGPTVPDAGAGVAEAAGRAASLARRVARHAPRPAKNLGRRLWESTGRSVTSGQAHTAARRRTDTDSESAGRSGNGGSPDTPAGSSARPNKPNLYPLDACATFDVPVSGIVHVGANRADEYRTYHQRTHGPLLYVEALPELAERARRKLDPARPHVLYEAVVSDVAGEKVTFHVASNDGGSSSMFDPGRHEQVFPWITFDSTLELVTERLDDIVAQRPERDAYNVLVLDVQGAELKVLQGAPRLLDQVDAVFTEVSGEPLYDGGCTFLDVATLLAEAGLQFRAADMNRDGWGDAFFTRPRTVLHEMLARNLAHGRPTRQSSYHGGAGEGTPRHVGDVLPRDYGVHTAPGDERPWWEVDLGDSTAISRIVFLDRLEHVDRAAALRISTSVDGVTYTTVYRRDGRVLEGIVDVAPSVTARFVRVSLDSGGPLHFRQLIVV